MFDEKMLFNSIAAIENDTVLNFEFVFHYLSGIYKNLNGLWNYLASSFDSGLYEIMLELGMSEDIAQGIQDMVSNSFFGDWSIISIALGFSIPALVTIEIIKYVKSLVVA